MNNIVNARRMTTAVLLSLMALVLGACGSSSSSGDGALTARIAKLVPLTGVYTTFGADQDKAFEVALDQLREKYGDDVKLEIKEFDIGDKPQTAIAGYQRAKAWKADVTIQLSGDTPQALAIAEAAKGTLQIASVGTPLAPVNPYGFGQFDLLLAHQYPAAIELLYDHLGDKLRSAAYVSVDTYQVGQDSTKLWREYLESKGVKTVLVDQVSSTDSNLSALARKITSLNPSIVVQDMTAPSAIALATALKRTGYDGAGLGGVTLATRTILDNAPGQFDGYFTMTPWSPDSGKLSPSDSAFIKAFKAKYPDVTPDTFSAYVYNGLTQYVTSVVESGSVDADVVAKRMQQPGPPGVGMDPIVFDKQHSLRMPISLLEIADNQAKVVATSDDE